MDKSTEPTPSEQQRGQQRVKQDGPASKCWTCGIPLPYVPRESAKARFERCGAAEETSALERLRAFCSFAMDGVDWLDVEPFFDALVKQDGKPAEPINVVAELMRGVDAYAWDYKTEGKLAKSRTLVERALYKALSHSLSEGSAAAKPSAFMVTWPDGDVDLRWPESFPLDHSVHYPNGPARVDPLYLCVPEEYEAWSRAKDSEGSSAS